MMRASILVSSIAPFSIALSIAFATLLASGASAQRLDERFARANEAYFQGDFDAAAADYHALIETGVIDPDVTFNLATTEARRGRLGAAVLAFEQTLALRPGDPEALSGLETARDLLGRRQAQARGEVEVEAGPPLAEVLFGRVSGDTLAVLTLALELILFGALIALLFVRRESVRIGLGITGALAMVLFGVSLFGLATRAGWLAEGEPAIVLSEEAILREGPDPRASERSRAREGQRALVIDEDREWLRLRIAGVGEGWIERAEVGLVRPGAQR